MTKPLPYSVVLTQEERDKLTAISGTPSQQMRTVRRAYILLMLDRGLNAPEISRQLGIVRYYCYNRLKRRSHRQEDRNSYHHSEGRRKDSQLYNHRHPDSCYQCDS